MIRQALKFGLVLVHIGWFMARGAGLRLIYSGGRLRRALAALGGTHARRLCQALGLAVSVEGRKPTGAHMVVANHVSYLDAVVLAAHLPGCFVTSVEVQQTPGLGLICELGGCLFVERRRKDTLYGEMRQAAEALRQGVNLIVFPEATSTDGSAVRAFKPGLFRAALAAERPILPAAVSYVSIDGEPVSRRNRDTVMWYGDMTFLPHLWALAGKRKVVVRVALRETLSEAPGAGARELAHLSRASILEAYEPVAPPQAAGQGLPELSPAAP